MVDAAFTPPVVTDPMVPDDARFATWTAADGHRLRRFDRPAAGNRPRGSLLFLSGRGDYVEKYLESLADWHAAGWNVTSFDWRGQGGSGRLTAAPHVGDIDDFGHYVSDLAGFWAEWRAATPGPHVVVGHSMGGHLTLRALVGRAIDPAAAVLVAPMLGLRVPGGAWAGETLARALSRLGDPARAAWKGSEEPPTLAAFATVLTHDAARYAEGRRWQAQDASLYTGPPSWRWLVGAFESCRRLRAAPALAGVATPILMLVAEHDRLVDPTAALAVAARLPAARVVRFGAESAHEILREVDPVRTRALAEIDAFLTAHAA